MEKFPKLFTIYKSDFCLYLQFLRKITVRLNENSETPKICCLT